jgi:hypothetical protein
MLTVYEPNTATYKHYVVATDRHLCESLDPSSPHLPPFHHVSEDRAQTPPLTTQMSFLLSSMQRSNSTATLKWPNQQYHFLLMLFI